MSPKEQVLRTICEAQLAKINLLTAENVRLRKDAERYWWLREHGECNEKSARGAVISKDKFRAEMAFRYWTKPEQLDAAIDNAKQCSPPTLVAPEVAPTCCPLKDGLLYT